MATLTFDPYEFMQTLKESGLPEKQAKAIIEGIKRIDMHHVASREDVAALENKMLDIKSSLIQWMVGLVFVQSGFTLAIMKLLSH